MLKPSIHSAHYASVGNIYVLSMSCQCIGSVLAVSCLCPVYVLSMSLCLGYVLSVLSMYCLYPPYILNNSYPHPSREYLCLFYVLSVYWQCFGCVLAMFCLCLVYVLSMSLCLVYVLSVLSMYCLYPPYILNNSYPSPPPQ